MHDAYAAARRRRIHYLLIVLLCLMTLAVYANSFQAGFPLDNRPLILGDNRLTAVNRANIERILTGNYWIRNHLSGLYRPVTTLSLLFNYAILDNGTRSAGYHAVNLALQFLNVALAYLLAWHIFAEFPLALATAALWAVHPVLTESVTNIVGRSDLLAGAAVLGGLLLHIRRNSLAALAAVSAVGIFSKESVSALPALMVLYDITFCPREWRTWRFGYVAVLLPLLFSWWVRSRLVLPPLHPLTDNPLMGAGFWTARVAALRIMGKYLGLLIFPGQLSFDYSYNQIPVESESWFPVVSACLLLLAVTLISWWRCKPIFFWIAFSLVAFLPTSNLIIQIGSIMAERFLYLPAIGFAACVAAGIIAGGRRLSMKFLAPVAVAALCAAFGYRAYLRNFDWKDDETLTLSGVLASPNSYKTHLGYGDALSLSFPAEIDHAIDEVERSIQIVAALSEREKPAIPFQIAGTYYRMKGEQADRDPAAHPEGGASWYRKSRDVLLHAASIDQSWDRRLREHQIRAGIPASRLAPFGLWRIYVQLGITYLHLNEPRRALEALQYGRMIAPYQPDMYGFMADAYGRLHDYNRQAIILMEVAKMVPAEQRPAQLLPRVWSQMGTVGCQPALRDERTGLLVLNMACPMVHQQACAAREDLAGLLSTVKQEDEAKRIRQEARTELKCVMDP